METPEQTIARLTLALQQISNIASYEHLRNWARAKIIADSAILGQSTKGMLK